jgi:cytochrome c-type biogenesis protein
VTDLGPLAFAFGLGTATFFAPCAFPLLPGYVAFFLGRDVGAPGPDVDDGTGVSERRRAEPAGSGWSGRLRSAVAVSVFTSLGLLAVFGALAAVVFVLGTRVLANVAILELVAGVVVVALGVAMLSGRTQTLAHVQLPERRRGPVGFFAFGVVYAVAAAGCTGSLFVGVVSLALTGPATAVATFGAYAAGMVVLLLGVTLLSALGRDTVLRRLTSNTRTVTRLAGGALVVAGLIQVYYFLFVFDGLAYL